MKMKLPRFLEKNLREKSMDDKVEECGEVGPSAAATTTTTIATATATT